MSNVVLFDVPCGVTSPWELPVRGLHCNIARRYGLCSAHACLHAVLFNKLIQQARRFPRLSVCPGGSHS